MQKTRIIHICMTIRLNRNPGATLICKRVPKTALFCERKELLAAVAAEDQILFYRL